VTAPLTHNPDVLVDDLVTVPLPRTTAPSWPGSGEVAFVPAALMLAVRGRCSCPNCVDGFVRLLRRTRLHTV
jgi:hypothetical protein